MGGGWETILSIKAAVTYGFHNSGVTALPVELPSPLLSFGVALALSSLPKFELTVDVLYSYQQER